MRRVKVKLIRKGGWEKFVTIHAFGRLTEAIRIPVGAGEEVFLRRGTTKTYVQRWPA